jgi:hypothetical protein
MLMLLLLLIGEFCCCIDKSKKHIVRNFHASIIYR